MNERILAIVAAFLLFGDEIRAAIDSLLASLGLG